GPGDLQPHRRQHREGPGRGARADQQVPGPGDRPMKVLLAAVALLGFSASARAEVIELIDKTKINGKIVHYYDGIYSVDTQGQTMKIPREKIRSISFQLPPARSEFSTAEKTFDRWRKAVTDGDLEKAIDCYALMYQGVVATHLGQSAEGIKQMKKEIEGTKFVV